MVLLQEFFDKQEKSGYNSRYHMKWQNEEIIMKKWKTNVRRVEPYTPGEQPDQPGMIKLNTNENPYPPAPEVREALRRWTQMS